MNSLSSSFIQYWSRRMQRKHYKMDVFRAIASFEEEEILQQGDRVHRPYRSEVVDQDYTRGTDLSIQEVSTTDEYLIVDKQKAVPFYIDNLDELQSSYKYRNQFADDCAKVLSNAIDGDILSEVANASNYVDDGTINGSAGNGITVTSSNVLKIITAVDKKLNRGNIDTFNRFGVISPDFNEALLTALTGRATPQGDQVGMNGFLQKYFNFDLHMSNASYWTGVLLMGTKPTAADTVTINGVTFTFVATIGTTAGNVLIGADVNASVANLISAINASSGAGTTYVEPIAADRAKLRNITAANGTTEIDITAKGKSYVVVSETLTAAGDVWTITKQVQHLLFGQKGSIDVVIQKKPALEERYPEKKLGVNLIPYTLYGKKTFAEGAAQLVDVRVRTDAF